MAVDQGLLQAGLVAGDLLPELPQLFQQQQAGIFGGGPAKEEAAARRNEPIGFLERKFGSTKKAKARTQKQRVKDARALGDLARTQGIETGPGLGQGIATQLQSTFGGQGAAQLLAEQEKLLPSNVAEQERLVREQRKASQREAVEFAQQTQNRELEARLKEQQIQASKAAQGASERQNEFEALTGFKNREDAVKTTLTIGSTNDALASIDTMIKIREDLGAIGPLDFMSNPEAVAAVRDFQKFEATNLFKTLANDTRLSDEDRIFYNSIIDLTATDLIFTGGKVELNQLRNMQSRLENSMKTYQAFFPELGEIRPDVFARKNFDDIGPAFEFQSVGGQTPEQQQALGLQPGPLGPNPTIPLGSFATGR